MKRTYLAAAVVALTCALPAAAQTPAVSPPSAAGAGAAVDSTSTKMPGAVNAQSFVQKVSMANQFEIDTSEIAIRKGRSSDVTAFAKQMVADHKKAGDQFKKAVASSHVKDDLPTATVYDADHQQLIDRLNGGSPAEFDKAYIEVQTKTHEDTVALVSTYAKTGDDPELKAWAQSTLPTLEEHLSHVRTLKASAG